MEIGNDMCLYHLWAQLEPEEKREKALEFFCRTCRVRNLDKKKAESLTYIQASYGLWDKKPVSGEEISLCMDRTSYENDISCDDVLQDYEQYHIQDVCVLCPHSSLYKNTEINKERTVLRRLLSDFEACCRGGKSIFSGMIRLAPDYAIGTYPVIPLHSYMYNYLLSFGMAAIDHTKNDFCENFSNYLIQRVLPQDLKDFSISPDVVKMVVKKEYNQILSIPLESILPDVFEQYILDLKQVMTRKVAHREKKSATVVSCGAPSALKNTDGQFDLMEVLEEEIDVPHPNAQNNTIVLQGNDSEEKITPMEATLDEVCADNTIVSDASEIVSNADLSEITLDPTETPVSNAANVTKEEHEKEPCQIETSENKETGETMNDQKSSDTDAPIPNKVISYDPFLIHLPEDWFGEDLHIFSRQGNYLQWITGAWQSSFLCVETVLRYGREGLVIYLSDNDSFYYLDLEVHADALKDLLSDGDGTVLTAHTANVYGLLYKYGYDHPDIHGLDILAGSLSMEECLTDDIRPVAQRMKDYPFLYRKLCDQNDNDNLQKFYTDNLQIMAVLAHSFSLSPLCPDLSESSIMSTGFMKFRFTFLPRYPWKVDGVLFRIRIPGLDPSDFSAASLAGQMIRLFDRLHHTYRTKAYPLAVYNDSFYIFYQGCHKEAMLFYDAYLIALMELYEKLVNRPLHSKSFCLVWQTHE